MSTPTAWFTVDRRRRDDSGDSATGPSRSSSRRASLRGLPVSQVRSAREIDECTRLRRVHEENPRRGPGTFFMQQGEPEGRTDLCRVPSVFDGRDLDRSVRIADPHRQPDEGGHGTRDLGDEARQGGCDVGGGRVEGLGIRSALSLPLPLPGQVVGAINVDAHGKDVFDDHAAELGELFAAPAAVAVHSAQILTQALTLTILCSGWCGVRSATARRPGVAPATLPRSTRSSPPSAKCSWSASTPLERMDSSRPCHGESTV